MNKSTHNKSLTSSQLKPITLAGSATIVTKFFRHACNSILFQRGVYGQDTFERKEEYGLTLFVSKDPEIVEYFEKICPSIEGWLSSNQLKSLSLVIISSLTSEVLEKWDFDVQLCTNNDTTIGGKKVVAGRKEINEVQKGIRNVMRQVTATMTFLPLLDTRCSFDLRIYLSKKAPLPPSNWKEEKKDVEIENGEVVELRSFSTSVQRVKGRVTYRGDL